MASSIGSRVAVVTGGTLFANQAKPSYIHQVTSRTNAALP